MAMEATTLWDAFQKHGDETARDQLLSQHLPLVHHVARQVLRTLSVQVELEQPTSAFAPSSRLQAPLVQLTSASSPVFPWQEVLLVQLSWHSSPHCWSQLSELEQDSKHPLPSHC